MVLVSGGSWPSDKGGRHPDPVIGGGGAVFKIFFRLFGPQFGLKIRGIRAPRAPPLDPSLLAKRVTTDFFLDNKRVSTLGARALVPGYRHKMVLCSHLDYLIV